MKSKLPKSKFPKGHVVLKRIAAGFNGTRVEEVSFYSTGPALVSTWLTNDSDCGSALLYQETIAKRGTVTVKMDITLPVNCSVFYTAKENAIKERAVRVSAWRYADCDSGLFKYFTFP